MSTPKSRWGTFVPPGDCAGAARITRGCCADNPYPWTPYNSSSARAAVRPVLYAAGGGGRGRRVRASRSSRHPLVNGGLVRGLVGDVLPAQGLGACGLNPLLATRQTGGRGPSVRPSTGLTCPPSRLAPRPTE